MMWWMVMTKNNNSTAFLPIGNPSQVFKAFAIYKNNFSMCQYRWFIFQLNKSYCFTVPEIYYQFNGFDHDHYYHTLHYMIVVCLRQYHVISISVFYVVNVKFYCCWKKWYKKTMSANFIVPVKTSKCDKNCFFV